MGAVRVDVVVPAGELVPEKGMRGVGLNSVLSLVTVVKVVGQLISVMYGSPVPVFTVVLPPDQVILTGTLVPTTTVFEVTVAVIRNCAGGYAWHPVTSRLASGTSRRSLARD